MATSPPTSRLRLWKVVGLNLVALAVAVGVFLMVMQILTLKAANQQLSASLATAQAQNARLEADNATLSATSAQQASQSVALAGQVTALQSQMGSVLGDERVGRAFFQSLLGLLDSGMIRQETCSASFLTTTAVRQECAYVESYYDQIDSIAGPYAGK
jgi:FtsZ-binding cell division protein ZapB